jgi:hypothetical protein
MAMWAGPLVDGVDSALVRPRGAVSRNRQDVQRMTFTTAGQPPTVGVGTITYSAMPRQLGVKAMRCRYRRSG